MQNAEICARQVCSLLGAVYDGSKEYMKEKYVQTSKHFFFKIQTKYNPILLFMNSIILDDIHYTHNYTSSRRALWTTTGQHILLSIYYWVLSTLSGHLVGGPAHHEGGDHHQHELHHLPLGPGLDSKELITIH